MSGTGRNIFFQVGDKMVTGASSSPGCHLWGWFSRLVPLGTAHYLSSLRSPSPLLSPMQFVLLGCICFKWCLYDEEGPCTLCSCPREVTPFLPSIPSWVRWGWLPAVGDLPEPQRISSLLEIRRNVMECSFCVIHVLRGAAPGGRRGMRVTCGLGV